MHPVQLAPQANGYLVHSPEFYESMHLLLFLNYIAGVFFFSDKEEILVKTVCKKIKKSKNYTNYNSPNDKRVKVRSISTSSVLRIIIKNNIGQAL